MAKYGDMGNLTPGTTYVYEKVNGVTYSREVGADPSTRRAIGWDYDPDQLLDQINQHNLWDDMRRAAKTNPALRDALDRAIVIYELSKEHGQTEHKE